jgi:hypothetical protein
LSSYADMRKPPMQEAQPSMRPPRGDPHQVRQALRVIEHLAARPGKDDQPSIEDNRVRGLNLAVLLPATLHAPPPPA